MRPIQVKDTQLCSLYQFNSSGYTYRTPSILFCKEGSCCGPEDCLSICWNSSHKWRRDWECGFGGGECKKNLQYCQWRQHTCWVLHTMQLICLNFAFVSSLEPTLWGRCRETRKWSKAQHVKGEETEWHLSSITEKGRVASPPHQGLHRGCLAVSGKHPEELSRVSSICTYVSYPSSHVTCTSVLSQLTRVRAPQLGLNCLQWVEEYSTHYHWKLHVNKWQWCTN